jgi:hypothetical protein
MRLKIQVPFVWSVFFLGGSVGLLFFWLNSEVVNFATVQKPNPTSLLNDKTVQTVDKSSVDRSSQLSKSVSHGGALRVAVPMTRDETFDRAKIIFVGEIVRFTPSFWNRDFAPTSIQEWESTSLYPYHQIIIRVLKPLVGSVGGQEIKVTESGTSPNSIGLPIDGGATVTAPIEHNLKVGDRGVFLLGTSKVYLLDKSGKHFPRQVISRLGSDEQSFMPEQGESYIFRDGIDVSSNQSSYTLEDLKARIKAAGRQLVEP